MISFASSFWKLSSLLSINLFECEVALLFAEHKLVVVRVITGEPKLEPMTSHVSV